MMASLASKRAAAGEGCRRHKKIDNVAAIPKKRTLSKVQKPLKMIGKRFTAAIRSPRNLAGAVHCAANTSHRRMGKGARIRKSRRAGNSLLGPS